MNSKYKLVKTKSGKTKKVVVKGVKKLLYKKKGSNKLYVASKGKMMNVVKYKKMKMKGGDIEQDGGKKSKKRKKRRVKGR
jgi:hypothetical protein